MLTLFRHFPLFLFILLPLYAGAANKSPEDFIANPPPQADPVKDATLKDKPIKDAADRDVGGKDAAQKHSTKRHGKDDAKENTAAVLDTAKAHAAYLEGDFDQAIRGLEDFLKAKKSMSHPESVFVYKHMGVMYAANKATQEKGKYYMYKLIEIEPTAKILDMYASDMIFLIFRNVQEDYESKHGSARSASSDAAGQAGAAGTKGTGTSVTTTNTASAADPAKPSGASRKNQTLYWAAGGAVLAVGTAALLFIALDNPSPKTHTITVSP